MAMALGAASLDEAGERIRSLLEIAPPAPGSLLGKFGALMRARAAWPMRSRKSFAAAGAQTIVMEKPDLTQLPVLTTWPLDAGPFITLPLVITKDPHTGRSNVGMYRMQVYGPNETGMHWQRHKHGRAHADAWGRSVPVAVAIGTDPVLTYAATAPLAADTRRVRLRRFPARRTGRTRARTTVDLLRSGRGGVRARRLRR